MSDTMQTAPPPSGPPPPPGRMIFANLDAKAGVWSFKTRKDGPVETASYLSGFLIATWIEWDPGNGLPPSDTNHVGPRWNVHLEIESRYLHEQTGELPEYLTWRVEVSAPVAALAVLECIEQLSREAKFIGLTPERKKNTTLMQVASWDGARWRHLFSIKNEAEESTEARMHAACIKIQKHWSWNKPAESKCTRKGVEEPPLPGRAGSAAAAPRPTTPPPGQQVGDALPHGGGTAPVTRSASAAGEEELSLNGFTWSKKPGSAQYEQPPTDKTREAWEMAKLGADLSDKEAGFVVDAICALVGWDQKNGMPMAIMWLAKEFLLKADKDQIARAIEMGQDEEYDAFADE